MDLLSASTKLIIFQAGVEYALDSLSKSMPIEDIVGQRRGQTIIWHQEQALRPTTGMIEGLLVDDQPAAIIQTAECQTDPDVVSFVFLHELGHVVMGHRALGEALLGFYTRREAEADAFAYAYHYTLAAQGAATPCGQVMTINGIYLAMKKIYKNDKHFVWSNRTQDIHTVKDLLIAEKARR